MVRRGPSEADAELVAYLRTKRLTVSLAQLERWRRAGVLPRNHRTYLGRGKGSASAIAPAAFNLAEAMARVSRRGRSIHEAILRMFTVSPLHQDLAAEVLPIPESVIRESLIWFIWHGEQTLDRRIERALRRSQGSTEEMIEIVVRMSGRQSRSVSSNPPPTAEMRPWPKLTKRDLQGMNALAVAKFLGWQEIGSRGVAEVLSGAAPSTSTAEEIQDDTDRMESLFLRRELAGQGLVKFPRHVPMEEAEELIRRADDRVLWDVRNKLARIAQVGHLMLLLRDDRTEKFLDLVYSSHTNVTLLYAAIPIAVTLETTAWHTMAALMVVLLTDDDARDWFGALDQLTDATRSDLLK
ncbi:hypothetical protein ACH415_05110 [Streptomyces californicus]|uniref:hypothetical protein n=1 Tax=Streptomyces californicus TaxID=67351 RepID=UPI0037ACE009